MTRKDFLKLCALLGVSSIVSKADTPKTNIMPTLFISHGSPMNIVEDNVYVQSLKDVVKTFDKPKAIVVVSAHWYTDGTFVSVSNNQNTIYDFYGFPKELYEVKYEPKGSPSYAKVVEELLEDSFLVERGLDHGAWSVLYHMYPKEDIPTFQISIDKNLSYQEYFNIGKMLSVLRKQGVLIIGSGGATHNLRAVKRPPYDLQIDEWAYEFDNYVKKTIEDKNFESLIDAKSHKYFNIAHPYDEHFIPLLYVAGMIEKNEKVNNFHEDIVLGNLSMRSFKVG